MNMKMNAENRKWTETDEKFMLRAMELADRGKGRVSPNPLVGAVIVRDGKVIGEGWHEYYGGLHAERNAFGNCGEDTEGATMYVTLEPCCHHGKTPPCVDAVIEHRIARVFVGLTDPNPLVAGKGIEKLRAAGIEVIAGVEEARLKEQNRVFLKYITTKMPWVVMKTAMSLDGKIATATGDSRWVTGELARHRVQEMRAEYMSVLVGAGTVKADDPLLNCRLEGDPRQCIRVVADSKAAISFDSRIIETARVFLTIIAHTRQAGEEQLEMISDAGAECLLCQEKDGHVDVTDLLRKLGAKGIDSVLLEGGGELNEAFIRDRAADELFAFIAPKIVGGRDARTPVEGAGVERMSDAVLLTDIRTERIGEDVLIRGRFIK